MNDMSAADDVSMVDEIDDAALVEAAQGGDAAAMNRLLSRHFNNVNRLCLRMLGDRDRAEDARQDALFQAARRISTFSGASSFGTWLHAIAKNACLNEIRSTGRRRTTLVDEIPETAPVSRPTQHRRPLHVQQPAQEGIGHRLDVEAAMASITPAYRDVLVCRFYGDMSYEETAEFLGIPLNTVRSRLKRGTEQLRGRLLEPDTASAVSKPPVADEERR